MPDLLELYLQHMPDYGLHDEHSEVLRVIANEKGDVTLKLLHSEIRRIGFSLSRINILRRLDSLMSLGMVRADVADSIPSSETRYQLSDEFFKRLDSDAESQLALNPKEEASPLNPKEETSPCGGLELTLEFPDDATPEQMANAAKKAVQVLNEIHFSLGGHGLQLDEVDGHQVETLVTA